MNALLEARKQSLKDIERYCRETPVEKRVEWLKDGEQWIAEHKKKNPIFADGK